VLEERTSFSFSQECEMKTEKKERNGVMREKGSSGFLLKVVGANLLCGELLFSSLFFSHFCI